MEKRKGNVIWVRLVAIAVIIIAFTLANHNYITLKNMKNLMTDIIPYFIMGMGVTFVLMIGSIDLSIGAMCSAATCVMAVFLPRLGGRTIVLTLMMGLLGGLINGFLVVKLKLPSFIATLGTMSVWQSVSYLVSGSQAVQIMRDDWSYIDWIRKYYFIVPAGFILCMVLWVLLLVMQHSTWLGKGCFAVGVNERAAQIAGVNVVRVKMLVFMICGLFSALSGVTVAAKLKGGLATAGDAMTMLSIAAVVLGGTALEGGKGGMISTMLGASMVIMIQNGLNMIGITSFYQDIVFGILIIIAVFCSKDRNDRHVLVK